MNKISILISLVALTFFSCASGSSSVSKDASTPIFKTLWRAKTTDFTYLGKFPIEHAQPAHSKSRDQLVVASSQGYVTNYRAANGEEIWRKKFDDTFYGGAKTVSDQVYLGSLGGFVRAIDLRNGDLLWESSIGASIESLPAFNDGRVFISDTKNGLHALDAATGEILWSYRRDPPTFFTIRGTCTPLIDKGTLYCGFSDGYLGAFQIDSGDVIWSVNLSDGQTEFNDINDDVFLSGDRLYVASYSGGVYALNAEDGKTIWHSRVRGVADFTTSFDGVFIATSTKKIAKIDKENGQAIWSFNLKHGAAIDVLSVGDYLLATSANGPLYVLDSKTGYPFEKWIGTNGSSAPPVWGANRLYLFTDSGEVIAKRIGWQRGH